MLETATWNALVVLFYAPVILGSLLWLLWIGGEWAVWTRTVGEEPVRDLALGLVAGVALLGASRGFGHTEVGARLQRSLRQAFGHIGVGSAVLMATVSALGEELLFRAVLQPRLGLVGASLLFGLAHVPLERDLLLWPVLAFASGLVLGGLFEYTGAALAPIVAHFLVNAINLASFGSGGSGSATSSRGPSRPSPRSERRRTGGRRGG